MERLETAFVFDLDGTLVDSVYRHVLAWHEALDAEGIPLSIWRIHRKIGMSGGLLTNVLLRETNVAFDQHRLDRLQRLHAEASSRNRSDIRPLPGARALLDALTDSGVPWAIATSGRMVTAGPALEALGVDPAARQWSPGMTSSTPSPNLIFFSPPSPGWGSTSKGPLSLATACGTCCPPHVAMYSVSVSCLAAMEWRNSSAPARIACSRTPPTCWNTSTKSAAGASRRHDDAAVHASHTAASWRNSGGGGSRSSRLQPESSTQHQRDDTSLHRLKHIP